MVFMRKRFESSEDHLVSEIVWFFHVGDANPETLANPKMNRLVILIVLLLLLFAALTFAPKD